MTDQFELRYGSIYSRCRAMAAPALVWMALAAMSVSWTLMVWLFGVNWPILDELGYLSYTVGEKPITWAMLWADHNGHRLVLTKLVYLGLMKISDVQPAFVMYVDVALLTLMATALLMTLRRARGKLVLTDVAIPLSLLAFSQYEDVLWAFQLTYVLSQTLVLLAWIAALRVSERGGQWWLAAVGIVTAMLPQCAGQGMSMAPAFIAWLLGIAILRLRRPAAGGRLLGAAAGLWGLAAGAVWCLTVRGLPPSPGAVPLQEALHSWAALSSLVSTVIRTAAEFFSSAFLPGALSPEPVLYRWTTWAYAGALLLLASLLSLMWRWWHAPSDRLRLSAMGALIAGFLLLTVSIGVNRGVYGPGAGAAPRYATMALLLPLCATITCSLYGPKFLRQGIPAAVALSLLAVTFGPHGTGHALHQFGNDQRRVFADFKRDIMQRPDITIEELVARYGTALFGPGDVRLVPELIETMARHRVGAFRGATTIPANVRAWTSAEAPIRIGEPQSLMTWQTATRGAVSNGGAFFTLHLEKPTFVGAVRVTFGVELPPATNHLMQLYWYQNGVTSPTTRERFARFGLGGEPEGIYTITFYVFAVIDRIMVYPSDVRCDFELRKLEILQPDHE